MSADNLKNIPKNGLAMIPLLQAGVKPGKMAEMLNIRPETVSRLQKKVKKYQWRIEEDTSLSRKCKRVAHKIVDDFQANGTVAVDPEGQPIKDMQGHLIRIRDTVKASDAVQLIKLQQGQRDVNVSSQSITFTQVNINQSFMRGEEPILTEQAQDIVVEADIKQKISSDDS